MDPVETPMVIGLGAMVLGIFLGSMTVTGAGSVIILATAILNIILNRVPEGGTDQTAMDPHNHMTLNTPEHIDAH